MVANEISIIDKSNFEFICSEIESHVLCRWNYLTTDYFIFMFNVVLKQLLSVMGNKETNKFDSCSHFAKNGLHIPLEYSILMCLIRGIEAVHEFNPASSWKWLKSFSQSLEWIIQPPLDYWIFVDSKFCLASHSIQFQLLTPDGGSLKWKKFHYAKYFLEETKWTEQKSVALRIHWSCQSFVSRDVIFLGLRTLIHHSLAFLNVEQFYWVVRKWHK